MSELSDYQNLFLDGAYLELNGQAKLASHLYNKIVSSCATMDNCAIDALKSIYGNNVYNNINTYQRAIECTTLAICCKKLLTIICNKFCYKNSMVIDREVYDYANIQDFFQWLSTKKYATINDCNILEKTYKILNEKEYVLVPVHFKNRQQTLYEIIYEITMGNLKL